MNTYMHNEDTMDNVLHKTGRVLNVDNIFTLRNEENGITIHKRAEHLFLFYEGVFIENLEEDICRSGADAALELAKYDGAELPPEQMPFEGLWWEMSICSRKMFSLTTLLSFVG